VAARRQGALQEQSISNEFHDVRAAFPTIAAHDTWRPGMSEEPATRQGWIIFCPDENTQLGDPFWDSEKAFQAAKAHNDATGHSASIQPYYE
jgi:hypothetical protein